MRARQQRKVDSQGQRLFLRIKHPTMDPRQITGAMAIEPLQTVTAGTVVMDGVRRLHSESYWIAELTGASMRELAEKSRDGFHDWSRFGLQKEELLARSSATEWDARILFRLKAFDVEAHRSFLQQVILEGGSVTLLINRGAEPSPFVLKRALAKLTQLGIELEVD